MDETRSHKLIIISILIAVVLVFFLNIYYKSEVISETVLERRETQFSIYRNSTEILFMGDSNTEDAMNPEYISNNSFNFASSGESYIHRYYKLNSILENENHIKVIVLPIDLPSFSSSYLDSFNNEWYWSRYMDYNDIMSFNNKPGRVEFFMKSHFPVLGNGDEIAKSKLLNQRELIKGNLVIEGDFSTSENKTRTAESIAANHFLNAEIISQVQVEHFKKILDIANLNNITVILVKYPITEEYYNASAKYIPDKEKYYYSIGNLTINYTSVYTLDYQEDYLNRSDLFLDANHMNYKGAVLVSTQFRKDIIEIIKKEGLSLEVS